MKRVVDCVETVIVHENETQKDGQSFDIEFGSFLFIPPRMDEVWLNTNLSTLLPVVVRQNHP